MTSHSHPVPASTRPNPHVRPSQAPGWLMPALVGVPLVGALLVFGVLSPSSLLYIGLFGGMMLVCMGSHGHGGGAGDHADHSAMSAERDLSPHSSGAQPAESGSVGLDDRAANDAKASETDDHDQHSSHGCH